MVGHTIESGSGRPRPPVTEGPGCGCPPFPAPKAHAIWLDAPSPLVVTSRPMSVFPCSLSLARPPRRSLAPCGPPLPVALGFQLLVG